MDARDTNLGVGFADVLACPNLTTRKGFGIFYCGFGNSERCEVDPNINTFSLPVGIFADYRNETLDLVLSALPSASSSTLKPSACPSPSTITLYQSSKTNLSSSSGPTKLASDSKTPCNGTFSHSSRRSVGIEAGIGVGIGVTLVVILVAVIMLLLRERGRRKNLVKELEEKPEATQIDGKPMERPAVLDRGYQHQNLVFAEADSTSRHQEFELAS